MVLDDEIEVQVEVLTGAPVPVTESTVLDRALCRVQVDDSRANGLTANGWSSVLEAR